jgi:DNA-binding transcriptional MerR regulator
MEIVPEDVLGEGRITLTATFSVSDIASLTGVPIRSVRHWALTDIILADPSTQFAGTGVHRQFNETEVRVCKVLADLRQFCFPVGMLLKISTAARELLLQHPHHKMKAMLSITDNGEMTYSVFNNEVPEFGIIGVKITAMPFEEIIQGLPAK